MVDAQRKLPAPNCPLYRSTIKDDIIVHIQCRGQEDKTHRVDPKFAS
jgi:hypothetical protein